MNFAEWLARQEGRHDSVGSVAQWLSDLEPRVRRYARTPGECWQALGGGQGGKELRDAVHVARLEWERHTAPRSVRRGPTGTAL
jgi:hypothetical protein